jgi:hypothetical protein
MAVLAGLAPAGPGRARQPCAARERSARAPCRRAGRALPQRARTSGVRAGPGAGADLVVAALSFTPSPTITGRTTLFRVAGMVGFNPASRIVIIQNLPALMAKLRGEGSRR